MPFATVEEVLEDLRNGRMIIIVDDEDRENEGDLMVAAQFATPEAINFMTRHARGLVCVAMTGERLDQLKLPMMVDPKENTTPYGTAFTVSVEAREGVTTGISAHDRARTIQALIDPRTRPDDLVRPGHVFPLRAREGGVLVRAGHTEAAVDLTRLAGLYPAGVICEILDEDGSMARLPRLEALAREHNLKIVSVAQIIAYRLQRERLVERVAAADLPTEHGRFRVIVYRNRLNGEEHVALVKGVISGDEPVLVRVHSKCLTGDTFHSLRCDCGQQLETAMEMIEAEGKGVLLYMNQEGRGIGLANKIKAYALQDQGLDTVEANRRLGFPPDLRNYGIGAQILVDLGVRKMRLMTNNPRKIVGLEGYGLEVVERVPIPVTPNEYNREYLRTKQRKLGHEIEMD